MQLLADFFSLLKVTPSEMDLITFEYLNKELLKENNITEEFNTLLSDDMLSNRDKEMGSDIGDVTDDPTYEASQLPFPVTSKSS